MKCVDSETLGSGVPIYEGSGRGRMWRDVDYLSHGASVGLEGQVYLLREFVVIEGRVLDIYSW